MFETVIGLGSGAIPVAAALGATLATLMGAMTAARFSFRDHRRQAEQERRESKLRERILERLTKKEEVTTRDFNRFRNSNKLTQHQAKRVVESLYSEELSEHVTVEVVRKLDALLTDLEVRQPYEDLPAEVRPSLIRIDTILSDPAFEEDRAVLTPVVNALHSYVELLGQKRRLNLHRNIAYGIGATSVVVGLAALLLAPSAEDLATHVAAEISARLGAQDSIGLVPE